MASDYPNRSCPTCGSTKLATRPFMAGTPPAEDLPLDELASAWRGYFRETKPFFTYRSCRDCGQFYSSRYFTGVQLGQLYGQMEDNTGGMPEPLLARTQRGYWEVVARARAAPGGGFLELGPDIGLFTREALRESTYSDYWLVEPNRAVHPALDRLLADRPHTLLDDPAQIAAIPDNSLALAVAIHVLDHLLEPGPLLALLLKKLRPGGTILAVTHNSDSLAARLFGARWPAFCLQHPQLYSPATLTDALARAGFVARRVTRTVNYFPVDYLLRHFLFAAGLGRRKLAAFPDWTIGLKLGNMAVTARKPS